MTDPTRQLAPDLAVDRLATAALSAGADIKTILPAQWPHPADFPAPPSAAQRALWSESDRAARPERLRKLRERMASEGVDGYFGLRWEHMRYLTGLPFDDHEVTGSGDSGKFLVGMDEAWVLADSRYTIAVKREAPGSTLYPIERQLVDHWPELVATAGVRRVAIEASTIPHLTWERLVAAAPDVQLIPIEGWVEAQRQLKDPSEIERVAAACAVADRALASLLPSIRPGVTEQDLALDLEWRMRTGGAERLAFDVACLAGPEAALPHGSPGPRKVELGSVLLFDFGAQVEGYRSDMTRTLFVGEPRERDSAVYRLVAASQDVVFERLWEDMSAAQGGRELPIGRTYDALARAVIEADGRWPVYGHGLGHGIGLATHELPGLGRRSPEEPLPRRTVFSVEPGIYLEGEMGVRIEDLVALDVDAGRVDRITNFPRDEVVVGI
ncbi:MAG TPA: Xaa-Pro peptidase family protein [Candidatus Limnocylindria bacterium]|nr:Xaa-Pro peptidase family protein [Candidatus Limnocylindria bacterium]